MKLKYQFRIHSALSVLRRDFAFHVRWNRPLGVARLGALPVLTGPQRTSRPSS